MSGFERPQALAALMTAATALFVMSGRLSPPYRRWARIGAVTLYGLTLAGVLAAIALWLAGAKL